MEDVLVIGGGFAGLAAGVALAKGGRRVRLLEQKPHLGGRARSFVDPTTGSIVDNGQHILMGCYRGTLRFLGEIGTLDRVRFQPQLTVRFVERPGRQSRLVCARLPAPWHLLVGVLRSASFSWREKLEVARLGRALESGRARRNGLEQLSVEEWLAQLGQSEKLRRNFWDLLSIAAMNEDPRRASAALFERVLQLALFTSPKDSCIGIGTGGLSDCYVQAAADYITRRGGRVETSRRVAGLLLEGDACRGARLEDGSELAAFAVLSAVPWFELARLLPPDVLRSEPFFGGCLALQPAPIISINLWFDRPVTDADFIGLRGTKVQWLFNKGKLFRTNENYVSLVLSGAHAHIGRPKNDLLEMALAELGELLPVAPAAKLRHSLIIKERFATFSPRWNVEPLRPLARTPLAGFYLAGDWTATGLPATIEGAVRSGYAAAEEILGSAGTRPGPATAGWVLPA